MGIDLDAMLRHKKNEARAIAEWARQPPGRDPEPLQALKLVTEAYPALRSGMLSHAIWRVRRRLASRRATARSNAGESEMQ